MEGVMIRSFRDRKAAAIASGKAPKGFPAELVRAARQKLKYLDAAHALRDLASPPGNRLEALKGDRAGQHSIRINDQWRICFRWVEGGTEDVEIVDYH
jgi:proteic killer suppression protein